MNGRDALSKNVMRPVHPGDVLKVDPSRMNEIVRGRRGVTAADTVIRLAAYFDAAPEFWMNLQSTCDLRKAQILLGKKKPDIKP